MNAINRLAMDGHAENSDNLQKTFKNNLMAYNQHLADRISGVLKEKRVSFEIRNMMGGLCYMINDKMAVGIIKDSLMVRIDPKLYEESLRKKGVRHMDFTGKILKGFLLVDPMAIDMQKELEYWVQLCLDFNPMAKSSKTALGAKKLKARQVKGKK
jgi:TfoX/Sxy family transcriptional regulator of competence genes